MTSIAKQIPHFDSFMPDGWDKPTYKVDRVYFWSVFVYLNYPLADFCVKDV